MFKTNTEFYDREKAKKAYRKFIEAGIKDTLVLIGKKGIGKTAFVKNILNAENCLYCEPSNFQHYIPVFYSEICKQNENISSEIIRNCIKETNYNSIYEWFNSIKYNKTVYSNGLTETEKQSMVLKVIESEQRELKYSFAKYLGNFLKNKYNYIVLDNLNYINDPEYCWLLELIQSFNDSNSNKLAILVFNSPSENWKDINVKKKVENYTGDLDIDINYFDDFSAYYKILNANIILDPSLNLEQLAENLYNRFKGSSELIFKFISILLKQNQEDNPNTAITEQEIDLAIKKMQEYTNSICDEDLNTIELLILAIIALAPTAIPANLLNKALTEPPMKDLGIDTTKYIQSLLDKKILSIDNYQNSQFSYTLTDLTEKESYVRLTKKHLIPTVLLAVYNIYLQMKDIEDSEIYIAQLGIQLLPSSSLPDKQESIIVEINNSLRILETKNKLYDKAKILNSLLEIENIEISKFNITTKDVKLLYNYGYYPSAYRCINNFTYEETYQLTMLKGDIQHLLLDKETARTYKYASYLASTLNDKLKALNRYILALTQSNKKDLQKARRLYNRIALICFNKQVANEGFVELLRNSNNVLGYEMSLKYTIRGYRMAKEINLPLEALKCLHNVCMLRLLYDEYEMPVEDVDLTDKLSFEYILSELNELEFTTHEKAYPYIDLALAEMFKYEKEVNENKDIKELNIRLQKASEYYSKAQLYAKSAYAINISRMSLLIINSYLHKENPLIKSMRKQIYTKYFQDKDNIKDFRTHRKILFSLALSSLITGDNDEGKQYLIEVQPHVFEDEIFRYNSLCSRLGFDSLVQQVVTPKNYTYYKMTTFIPWLISFAH